MYFWSIFKKIDIFGFMGVQSFKKQNFNAFFKVASTTHQKNRLAVQNSNLSENFKNSWNGSSFQQKGDFFAQKYCICSNNFWTEWVHQNFFPVFYSPRITLQSKTKKIKIEGWELCESCPGTLGVQATKSNFAHFGPFIDTFLASL